MSLEQVVPHYQGIYDFRGRLAGLEVLARQNVNGTWESAAGFVQSCEETGCIDELDRHIWRCVVADICRFDFGTTFVTINTSVVSLQDAGFVDDVATIRNRCRAIAGVKPKMYLEVTETARVSDLPGVVSGLKALKGIGVGLILDDFGSGFNSLGLLLALGGVSFVKFSKEITDVICNDDWALEMARRIVVLAIDSGAKVIFEGVEKKAQMEQLRMLGQVYLQGWYFSKALPVEMVVVGERRNAYLRGQS